MDDKFNNNAGGEDLKIEVNDLFSNFTSSDGENKPETPPVDFESIDFDVLDQKENDTVKEEVYADTTDKVVASSDDDYSDFDFGDFNIDDMPDYGGSVRVGGFDRKIGCIGLR